MSTKAVVFLPTIPAPILCYQTVDGKVLKTREGAITHQRSIFFLKEVEAFADKYECSSLSANAIYSLIVDHSSELSAILAYLTAEVEKKKENNNVES